MEVNDYLTFSFSSVLQYGRSQNKIAVINYRDLSYSQYFVFLTANIKLKIAFSFYQVRTLESRSAPTIENKNSGLQTANIGDI